MSRYEDRGSWYSDDLVNVVIDIYSIIHGMEMNGKSSPWMVRLVILSISFTLLMWITNWIFKKKSLPVTLLLTLSIMKGHCSAFVILGQRLKF